MQTNSKLQEAKNVDLVWYLSTIGIEPVKENGRTAYYLSPFREEDHPSFSINKVENRWQDWGESHSESVPAYGDIIDFVSRYDTCTTKEAIDKIVSGDIIQNHKKKGSVNKLKEPAITIHSSEKKITSEYLINYLHSRCIDISFCEDYLYQLEYSFQISPWSKHIGVGFMNDSGGYEIRSPKWKGGNAPKNITTIKGDNQLKINVFEGFTDFLSALTYLNTPKLANEVMVLNSLSFVPMVAEYLLNYDEVNLFLDNDSAGDDKVDYLMSLGDMFVDKRDIYSPFNDFNNFIINL
jgi:hypothetical protein